MTRLVWIALALFMVLCLDSTVARGQGARFNTGNYHWLPAPGVQSGKSDTRLAQPVLHRHLRARVLARVQRPTGGHPMKPVKTTVAALGVVALLAGPASADVKEDLKNACTPDAISLCSASIPSGRAAITACMKQHWASVSAPCKAAVDANHAAKAKAAPVAKAPKPEPKNEKVAIRLPKIKPGHVASAPATTAPAPQPEVRSTPPKGNPPMSWLEYLTPAFALLGALVFVFYVGKLGLKPVLAKIVGSVGVAKADFAVLEERLKALETTVKLTTGLPAVGGSPLPPPNPKLPPTG